MYLFLLREWEQSVTQREWERKKEKNKWERKGRRIPESGRKKGVPEKRRGRRRVPKCGVKGREQHHVAEERWWERTQQRGRNDLESFDTPVMHHWVSCGNSPKKCCITYSTRDSTVPHLLLSPPVKR
jgi:hypothetical protein